MAIRGVTFDAGSTLLYPCPDIAETFLEVAAEHGIDVEPERVLATKGPAYQLYEEWYETDGDFWKHSEGCANVWLGLYRFMAREVGLPEFQDVLAQGVYDKYLQADHWQVYDDVVPCLEALRGLGLKLGVVSNWDVDLIPTLHNIGLGKYFDDIVTSALVGERKPQPAIFHIAMKRLGLSAGDVLHVGDLVDADGDGAASAGIAAAIIDRKGIVESCPYQVISRLTELPDLIA